MYDMGAWDLLAFSDARMINAAMIARQNELITKFFHRSETFRIRGQFGPWQIVPGGTMQYLKVQIPILNGQLRVPGYTIPTELDGLTLTVRITLRLLPIGDHEDTHDLVFDFDELAEDDGAVRAIKVDDPDGRLDGKETTIFKVALGKALSAGAKDVSFVFGSVQCRGSLADDSLRLPYQGWANLETSGGKHFLVLGGAFGDPKSPLQNIDPEIIKADGSAYLALSKRFLMTRVIYPSLEDGFHTRAPFRLHGTRSSNMAPIDLGVHQKAGFTVRPIVRQLHITQADTALKARAVTFTEVTRTSRLECTVDLTMPFHFDPKTKILSFKEDKNPTEHHQVVGGSSMLDVLVRFIIYIILAFNNDAFQALIRHISSTMQGKKLKAVDLSHWDGVRDFQVDDAVLKGALVLRDTHPFEESMKQGEVLAKDAAPTQ